MSRVENRGVNLGREGTRLKVEVVVVVSHDAGESTLSRDTHRPRAHIASSRAGTRKTNESRKISNISRPQSRGDPKKVFRTNQLVTLDRVTFVEPRRGYNISRV